MEKKDKLNSFPKYILYAPKIKYKKPTKRPTPLFLSESSYSIDHSYSDIEDNISSKDESVDDTRAKSTSIKNNTVIQN